MAPPPAPAIAQWFARAYNDPQVRVTRSHERTTGALFRLKGKNGAFWLRIGGVMRRELDTVEAEGRIVTDLAANGFRLAKPLKRVDGHYAGVFDLKGMSQPAIAYGHLSGSEITEPTSRQAQAIGEAVAALHIARVEASALPPAEPIARTADSGTCCMAWLPNDEARWLQECVERAHAEIAKVDLATRTTICHGDLRLGNVSFSGEQPTLFDFEAMALAPPAYDLACLWRRRVIECAMTESIPDWDSFLRGYERARPLVDAERHLVKLLALLRAVWTMSLPAQPGAMWGADWVRDPAYWRDHIEMVRWFARAAQI